MSKTNRFTLIATFLLGVLLYTVLRFADNLPEAPMADTVRETAPVQSSPDPENEPEVPAADTTGVMQAEGRGIPTVSNYDELVAHLDERGLNGRLTVEVTADWYAERGYLGGNALLGVTADAAPMAYYETLDDATLQALSDAGDAGATQTLARHAMFLDPFRGLELYELAVKQGSLYAIVKVSDTLDSFSGAYISDFAKDRELRKKMMQIRLQGYRRNLGMAAYATAVAAIRDGGRPIVDNALLNWIGTLEDKTARGAIERACEWSEEKQIGFSTARRSRGKPPLFTEPPPVFLSQPELEASLPCADTDHPVNFVMNLSDCTNELVVGPDGAEWELYVCP